MTQRVINIARDFSRYPAGRYKTDGPYAGEFCREKLFVPALIAGDSLVIELDGTRGYGSSFLEEAFGGLVREDGFSSDDLKRRVKLVTKDDALTAEIWEYITEAKPK